MACRPRANYLISEKLLNFAEAAATRPDFAHELPMFVAQVRRLIIQEEIRAHLAILIPGCKTLPRPSPNQARTSSSDFRPRISRPGMTG
jgi:hypothetical protein